MTAIPVQPPTVKGWCPGALRPMASGDGLIVRVKIPGGSLDTKTLRNIAALGARCGNGAFDLSHRANLQMRGVSDATLSDVQHALSDLGLLSPDAESEQVTNVVAPPLSGCDAGAIVDGRALATALESRLRADKALHALPGKFGFVVDDGGSLSMSGVDVDIALEGVRSGDDPAVALRLAGDKQRAALVAPERAVDSACALAEAFLALRAQSGARRMRALVATLGADAVFAAAGLAASTLPRRAPTQAADILGMQDLGGSAFVGCAAPFGRWRAETLEKFVDLVERAGGRELRLTPWRAILATDLANDRAAALAEALALENLIVDGADPRLAVAACPGAPECPHASVRTHVVATALAPLFAGASGLRLHVTGCLKGCAHPRAASFALVGRDGLFYLVRDGAPDAPAVARGLDFAAARCAIESAMREVAPT